MTEPRLIDEGPVFDAAGLVYRVREPEAAGPRPVVVMLHGRSGHEDAMWVFSSVLPDDWFVVAPRGPKPDPVGGYAWRPRQRDEWPTLQDFGEAVSAVRRLLGTLLEFHNADRHRIYLMGFSQGAAAAYATAMQHPELIQGIAGLVGFVPTECGDLVNVAPLSGLPIFMAVGLHDPFIPLERSQACARTLRTAGAQLDYHEYDTGHRLPAQAMRDLEAWWQGHASVTGRRSGDRV